MVDILNLDYRLSVINQIESDENYRRKMESLKRYEVYKDRLEEYVYNVLGKELSQETLNDMRVISSINLTPRIIDQQSSIYNELPVREYINADDKTKELIENAYRLSGANRKLKLANKYLNLQHHCTLQVLPKDGVLKVKVMQPHNFDVIPNSEDPSKADVYILSQFDKNQLFDYVYNSNNYKPMASGVRHRERDRVNNIIGDSDDWQSRRGSYVWWSKDFHFLTDAKGNIIDPTTGFVFKDGTNLKDVLELIKNPILELPFIDVKEDTDFEYWQRFGNSTVDFSIQMATILSDTSEVNRLQGFAQPIISAVEPPVDLKIGPNNVLFLKKSKNADASAQPTFEFASPNPDLQGSIEIIRTFLSMFLTSKGLDPSVVTADGTSTRYASGIDRLLSNIEKFQASQDQFDLFKTVEVKLFNLFKKWLDSFSGVSEANGGLISELSGVIPEDVKLSVKFQRPQDNMSNKDKYDLLIKKVEDGTMSMVELIMQDREVSEDTAREILQNIKDERAENILSLGGNVE